MEPPTPAATLAMTSSKAGWGSSSKAHHYDMMIKPLNQVDKMCPGEPEKVFHIDAEFFLNLLLQFPLRLQVIIFVGPINKTSTTYTWPQSLWFLPSFFCQEIRPVPIFCNQWGVKHLVPEHLGRRQYVRDLVNLFQVITLNVCSLLVRATAKKRRGPHTQPSFSGFWDPFHILDMEVLSQGPMDRLRNGKTAKIISQARCALGNVLVTKIWFQVFYDQFDTLVLEEMADAWS